MNDRPDESPEIAEVRRLLAEARHTEPMPDDVAARMDRVLSGLGDETPSVAPARPAAAEVIPITAHRRRRAAQLLVAAAAVVVGGVVVSHWHPSSSSDSATTDTAGSEAQAYDSGNDQSHTGQDQGNGKQGEPQTPGSTAADMQPLVRHDRLVVRPRHFADDALAGRKLLSKKATRTTGDFAALGDCSVGTGRRAELLAASYQGAPAALLYRHAQDSAQIVDLFVCGSTTPIRTITLPVP